MNDFDYDIFDDMDDMSPMYDDVPGANLWYEEDDVDEGVKVGELLELCIEPTIRDGFGHVGKLLLWCFLFRVSTQMVSMPMSVCHAVSAGTGLFILHHFFRSTMYYIVGFTLGAYLALFMVSYLLKKHRGPIMGLASVAFLII